MTDAGTMDGSEVEAPPAEIAAVSLWRRISAFIHHDRLALGRYFVAGVAVSLGYTATVAAFVELLHWEDATLANIVSMSLWTPVSYIVHRDFTFRANSELLVSAFKFSVTFVARLLALIAVTKFVSDILGIHYLFGVLANWFVLPLINYFVLKLWVFRARRRAERSRDLPAEDVERSLGKD